MTRSLLQGDQKECYLTGCQSGLDRHHIYGGPNRSISEQWGCWVWLKHDLHMRLHDKDKALDKRLKQDCQNAFEAKYGHDQFMKLFLKNYLD